TRAAAAARPTPALLTTAVTVSRATSRTCRQVTVRPLSAALLSPTRDRTGSSVANTAEIRRRRHAGLPPERRDKRARCLVADLAGHVADRLAGGQRRDCRLQPNLRAPAAERN